MNGIRVYLSVDMEGVAGVVSWHQTGKEGAGDYDKARKLMTAEVNAAVEGILQAVGDGLPCEVIVNDAHGRMTNLLADELHPKSLLLTGAPKLLSMMHGIDSSFWGAVFVGYHSMLRSSGVLAHSYFPGVVEMKLNGLPIGEFALNAYTAGYFGVPVVAVTGDDVVAQEASTLIPNIEAIQVKWAAGRMAAICLPPQEARRRIAQGVQKAVLRQLRESTVKPLSPPSHSTFELTFANPAMADGASLLPGAQRLDPLTVAYRSNDYLKAVRAARVMMALASSMPADPY
ncbi:MAG: M55 family metallopeptidase [Bacillota bacterium]